MRSTEGQIRLFFAVALGLWSLSTLAAVAQGRLWALVDLWQYLPRNPFFCGICLIPVGILLGLVRAGQRGRLLLGLALIELTLLPPHLAQGWLPAILSAGVGSGFVSSLCLLVGWVKGRDPRWALAWAHSIALLLLFALQQQMFWINCRSQGVSATYDLYYYAADVCLGPPVCFLTRAFFDQWEWLSYAGYLLYALIGQMMSLCVIYWFFRPVGSNPNWYFLAAGAVGLCGYMAFPGIGPELTFSEIFPVPPAHVPVPTLIFPPGKIPRNSMPSLHVMWAYSVWYALKGQARPLPWLGLGYAIIMPIVAFLGSHYLIDYIPSLAVAPGLHYLVDGATRQGQPVHPWLKWGLGAAALLGCGVCPLVIYGYALWSVQPLLLIAYCWLCFLLSLGLSRQLAR